MSKFLNVKPNLNQEPEYPVIKGSLFLIPNAANRSLKEDEKEKRKSLGINFIFDSSGDIAEERKSLFGEENMFEPFVQIWAHNAKEEGEASNWVDHGIPDETQNAANIKMQHPKFKDGLFPPSLPASYFKGLNEGDHLYLLYEDNDGHKCCFDLTCQQNGYRYESHGDFNKVFKSVMARGGFAL